MTFDEFDKFQQELIDEVMKMNLTKGKEYAHSESRFANFDRLAEQLGIPNYKVGWVYCAKHIDSIISFMMTGQTFSNETLRGRFVDAITYLTLIAGMIEEKEAKEMEGKFFTGGLEKTPNQQVPTEEVDIQSIIRNVYKMCAKQDPKAPGHYCNLLVGHPNPCRFHEWSKGSLQEFKLNEVGTYPYIPYIPKDLNTICGNSEERQFLTADGHETRKYFCELPRGHKGNCEWTRWI